ncbi:MAG TPA: peptidylprolyl isomerase [Nannocystaceae bacterium]|nr:peptidylprolyl isomerase [Nannocystaceae bacterium]
MLACKAALHEGRVGTKSFGCVWGRRPVEDQKATRAAAKDKLAAFQRQASAPQADFVAVASAAGLFANVTSEPTRLERLDPELRAALKRAKPGRVSAPLLIAEQYRVVQLIELLPAGRLPLAHARGPIVARLRGENRIVAVRALRSDLDRRYPIALDATIDPPERRVPTRSRS